MEDQIENQSRFHWLKKLPVVPLLFFLGAFITYRGWHGKSTGAENSAPPPGGSLPARGAYFKTSFQNESEFIVESIATDIGEMALYAKTHTAPKTNLLLATATEDASSTESLPIYKITIKLPKKDLEYRLKIDPSVASIWSPETYSALTKEIFEALGLKGTSLSPEKAADTSMLNTLLGFTPTAIETENQKLSAALDKNFTDVSLHEKAALLMGAFAMRENSGYFFEIRFPLCRMTAHLALGRALGNQSPSSVNGKLAEALLYTLMNNEKPALEKIALLDKTQPALAAWSRALTARNTHDYRPLAAVTDRTALESIEYFRAFGLAVSGDIAWEKLKETEMIGTADRSRIVDSRSYTVSMGHVLLRICIPLDLKEAATVYQLSHGHTLRTQAELVAALNELPERCVGRADKGTPRIQVIGWGQWAMFEQRHLCQAIVTDYNFMMNQWGVPEEGRAFSGKMEPLFSGLRLFPFVRKFTSRDEKSYHDAVDDSLAVVRTTPQIVASGIWNQLFTQPGGAKPYNPDGPGRVCEWHTHNPPPGTAYDPYPRFAHDNLVRGPNSTSRIQRMYDLSPYDCDIQYSLMVGKYDNHANFEQTEAIFRPVLGYDGNQLYFLAQRATNDPARFEATMSKAASQDPVYYYMLADYLVGIGQQPKAIPYIEKGMALCQDGLWMATEASLMIKYYLKNGEMQKAAKLADDAAEVYSADGLKAKAEFLEALGKYPEALDYYKKIEERYQTSGDLVNFCQRYKAKTGRTDYDEIVARRNRSMFPKGMETVTLKDFNGPAQDGMLVAGENGATAKAGLHQGNVIVALNGIRVHTQEQYLYVRSLSDSPELNLIVWQDKQYREIKASPPKRSFGVSLPDYHSNYAAK